MSPPNTPPYLLEEDEETVCYLAIGDSNSGVYQRLFHKTNDKNVRKPTKLQWDEEDLSAEDKFMLCLGDIVFSIQYFSDDPIFPIGIRFYDDRDYWSVEYGYDFSAEEPEPEPEQAVLPDQTEAEPAEPELNGTRPGEGAQPQGHIDGADSERIHIQLSPQFLSLPWAWFHYPTPTGHWLRFTRGMFEGLPISEQNISPVVGPAVPGDSQREMLLRMLRSASQATPQESPAEPAVPAYSQGAFRTGQIPLSPHHTYGTVNAGPSGVPYQHLGISAYTDMAGDQGGAYTLYPQDQRHQQGYNAQASQQLENQMATMRLANAQGNSRPKSSRRNGERRARNQPDEAIASGGYQKRHAHRGIGGP